MVVVERARRLVGREVNVRVTSVVTTANGRLVFAHLVGEHGAEEPPPVARAQQS
jgi:hypothetical protein